MNYARAQAARADLDAERAATMNDNPQETARPVNPHYAMVIEWSDKDHTYVVRFPEWGDATHTHGASYEEAVRNGHDVLEDLIDLWREQGRPLPQPRVFASA
jgi:predicted RNase H-like HicB family nuclease